MRPSTFQFLSMTPFTVSFVHWRVFRESEVTWKVNYWRRFPWDPITSCVMCVKKAKLWKIVSVTRPASPRFWHPPMPWHPPMEIPPFPSMHPFHSLPPFLKRRLAPSAMRRHLEDFWRSYLRRKHPIRPEAIQIDLRIEKIERHFVLLWYRKWSINYDNYLYLVSAKNWQVIVAAKTRRKI